MPVTRQTRKPASVRKEQILAAAGELFSRKGFAGTTTRELAAAARLNEALLFRHFGNKEEIYWAVLEQRCRLGEGRRRMERRLEEGQPDFELFSGIAHDILERHREMPELMRLFLYSALESHSLSDRMFRTYSAQFYETLASHIEKRKKEGKFRADLDALLAARGFIGMVFYHHMVQNIFGGKQYQTFDPKQVAETLAEIWLRGMVKREENKPSESATETSKEVTPVEA
jgi:TetR/AcrR family transcriptional regulator